MMIFVFDRVEDTVEKRENAGYQHFLLFPQCFQKSSFLGSLKVELCGKELTIQLYQLATAHMVVSVVVR